MLTSDVATQVSWAPADFQVIASCVTSDHTVRLWNLT